jgi:cytochrome P450 enzyme
MLAMGDDVGVVFNPEDPAYIEDPYPTYRRLREEAPRYHWAAADAWIVSRYDEVQAVMRDRRLTLSRSAWEHTPPPVEGAVPDAFQRLMARMLFQLSEKDHTRVRKLASPAFTPRAIESMRGHTERIVDDALARCESRSEIDIVADLAEQVPLRVIGAVLGIPPRFEAKFRAFAGAMVELINPWLPPEQAGRALALIPDGLALLEELVAERRRTPSADLLSTLIHHEEEGERLTTEELLSLVGAIIIAGAETTTHLISFAVWNLLRDPEQLAILRAEPGLLRNALEEVLRFDSFGKLGNPRYALEPYPLGDVTLRPGQMIIALMPAALRDPDIFPDPDRFDIRRDTSRSISFGLGAHYCMGAALARLEGEVTIGRLLHAFPRLALAAPPTYAPHVSMRCMSHLPVRLHG